MADTRTAQQRYMPAGDGITGSNSGGAIQRGPASEDGTGSGDDVFEEAIQRANEAWIAERDNIDAGRDCQRFYAARDMEQWDEKARSTRQADGRPILQINRLPQFVRQVTGELRKAPPELKFLPAKEGASQETAEALNGIKRTIDAQSNGKDCYVIATENACQAGQGAWRILTEYADDESFDLEVRKRPLKDPFGFLIDPYTREADKSDMRYAFIYDTMSVRDFEADYPGFTASDMPQSTTSAFPWRRGESVRIAEYWKREKVKSKLHLLDDGSVTDDLKAAAREGTALKPIRSRDVETIRVRYWMMTGKDILSGPHEWAGRYIPLCIVTGEELTMDSVTVRKGMIHDARDPQRIYNYSRSASVEAVALQPKAPFVATVDQIRGHEATWATAGSKNHSVLPYNADPKASGPPQRSQPPIASQGLDAQATIAAGDMEAVIGIYKASLGAPSNETSGIAIARKQDEGDTGTYLYLDNLARAIGYEGKILADLIPKIYDRERIVRILKEDGTADMARVNSQTPEPPEIDERTGQPKPPKPMLQLNAGKYDVVVTTGPSFASRRQEAWANLTEMARAYPPLMQIAGDLIMKNADIPGADEIAKRIERTLPPGVKDDMPAQPPQPNPTEVAKAAKDAASADKTVAETEKVQVETATLLVQLQASMAQIQAMLAGGAPMGGPPGGSPPPGGSMPAPPPAPDMPLGEPPMVELEEIGGAPV